MDLYNWIAGRPFGVYEVVYEWTGGRPLGAWELEEAFDLFFFCANF